MKLSVPLSLPAEPVAGFVNICVRTIVAGVLGSDTNEHSGDDASSPDASSDEEDSLSDVEPGADNPSGAEHSRRVTDAAPSTSRRTSVNYASRGVAGKRKDVCDDPSEGAKRRRTELTAATSHSSSRRTTRGNSCMEERDVELLAAATRDYRTVTVRTYQSVLNSRIISLLREFGGNFAEMANRYDALINGRRILVDRL